MWHGVKAGKGLALVAFFLPWLTVSCSSTELMRASGWDLALGKPRLSPQLAQMAGDQVSRSDAHPSIWLILALIAVVVGLALAFLPARRAAAAVLGTSVAAAVLVLVGTRNFSNEAMAKASAGGGSSSGMDRAMAAQIHIDWQIGYWLCLAGLVAAAVLAGLSLARRDRAGP